MGERGVEGRPAPAAAWPPWLCGFLRSGWRDWPLLHKRVNGVSHTYRVYCQAPEYLTGPTFNLEDTHQNVLGLHVWVAPS